MWCVLVLKNLVRSSFIIGSIMFLFGEDCIMYYFGIDFIKEGLNS